MRFARNNRYWATWQQRVALTHHAMPLSGIGPRLYINCELSCTRLIVAKMFDHGCWCGTSRRALSPTFCTPSLSLSKVSLQLLYTASLCSGVSNMEEFPFRCMHWRKCAMLQLVPLRPRFVVPTRTRTPRPRQRPQALCTDRRLAKRTTPMSYRARQEPWRPPGRHLTC